MRTHRQVARARELADAPERLGDDGHRSGAVEEQERVEEQREVVVAAQLRF